MTLDLFLLAAFLLSSAFFSGSETALVSLSRLRIRRIIEQRGERASALRQWEQHSDRLLTTILVGNNIVNTAATSLAAVFVGTLVRDPETAVWVNTVVMTSLILLFGEVLPKQVAKQAPEAVALRLIGPLVIVSWIFRPLVWFFGGIVATVSRLLGARHERFIVSRADVEAIIAAAGEHGSLADQERLLIEEALEFRRTTVHEILTPRVQMVTIRPDVPLGEAKRVFAETGFSRLPVESDREIAGIVYAKDLILSHEAEDAPAPLIVGDLMRPATFVPDVIPVERLMEIFRANQTHMAIVIGEHGDIIGLVTMENVLEKLVGRIEDEYDRAATEIRRISDRRWLVKGSARLDEIRRTIGVELPEGDYETIGGYITHELGRIPSRGAAIRWDEWLIQVYDADERRVIEVSLQRVGIDRDRRKSGGDDDTEPGK